MHNYGLHNLHVSLNIIKVIKTKTMGRTGNVARMGEIRNAKHVSLLQ
jgi:hypothetical protein